MKKDVMDKEKQTSYVYMVKCEDDTIYTGITKDVEQRMRDHFLKTEKGAKYTRSRKVKTILMVWETESYSSAARLEYAIKKIPRSKKLQLIQEPQEQVKLIFPKLEEENYVPKQEYAMDVSAFLNDKTVDKDGCIC